MDRFRVPLNSKGCAFWELGTQISWSAFLERKSRDHHVLLSRIPRVEDVQSAWALLLHCASARANS